MLSHHVNRQIYLDLILNLDCTSSNADWINPKILLPQSHRTHVRPLPFCNLRRNRATLTVKIEISAHHPTAGVQFLRLGGAEVNLRESADIENVRSLHRLLNFSAVLRGQIGIHNSKLSRFHP